MFISILSVIENNILVFSFLTRFEFYAQDLSGFRIRKNETINRLSLKHLHDFFNALTIKENRRRFERVVLKDVIRVKAPSLSHVNATLI